MESYIGQIQNVGVILATTSTLSPHTFPYVVSPVLSDPYLHFLLNVTSSHEPRSHKEVSLLLEWVKAMESELQALESNQTWELESLPAGKRPVGSK